MSSLTQSKPSFEIVAAEDTGDDLMQQNEGEEMQCEEVDMNDPHMDPVSHGLLSD